MKDIMVLVVAFKQKQNKGKNMIELSIIGTGVAVIGLTYTFLRNFKNDVNKKIDRLETRLDQQDDRMFWLMTGKTLSEAILEEKLKQNKNL